MSEHTENLQPCPFADCDAVFDVVEASYVGAGPACPGCGATWKQLCAAVDPAAEPENIETRTNFDGSIETVEVAR